MNNLQIELNQLEDQRLAYVMARSKVNSDAQGHKEAGITHATFYSWKKEERKKLNELAQKIKREIALRAIMILQDATEEAAIVKVHGLKSRNEHIKQGVATEILDRGIGKVTDKVDVTSNGKEFTTIINVKLTDESDD
ncbi:MAG: hypothetical protein WC998_08470 [Candidatus Paceibacterota bacterium]|jgi:hypothetical protein